MLLTRRIKVPHSIDFVNVPTVNDLKDHSWPQHVKRELFELVEEQKTTDEGRSSPRLLHGDLLKYYDRRRIVYLTHDAKCDLMKVWCG